MIGEDPQGVPNNLMPYLAQVAVGRREKLMVYGHDYDTPDGTGVRDYIHIMDVAEGHVTSVKYILRADCLGTKIFNLGTGGGASVLQVVETFEKVSWGGGGARAATNRKRPVLQTNPYPIVLKNAATTTSTNFSFSGVWQEDPLRVVPPSPR